MTDLSNTHKINPAVVFSFLLAGKALLTIFNQKTENHHTYRIKAPGRTREEQGNSPILFVSVLTGPENNSNYTYIGVIVRETGQFRMTRGSKLPMSDRRVRGFVWLVANAFSLWRYPHVEVRHHNQCGACARTLTVPESIDSGLGPICAKRLGVTWQREDHRAA